jgi:chromate transporter
MASAKYPACMPDAPAPPPLSQLFLGFLFIGMYGFGGVLPWARRMAVEQKRWLTAAEFTDMLGPCQFLPGGNIMNMTIALRARFHGAAGSVVAFVGLVAASAACVISTNC